MSGPSRVTNLKGESGGTYKNGSGALSIDAGRRLECIVAHAATVLSSVTAANIAGTLTNVNLPAGMVWYGKFTAATLSSGEVTGYYEN